MNYELWTMKLLTKDHIVVHGHFYIADVSTEYVQNKYDVEYKFKH